MQRFWELILGLERGFLAKEGEFSLRFQPRWPGQEVLGEGLWNLLLVTLSVALVAWVYRREGRSRGVKIALGAMRLSLLLLVIALLNRPVLHLSQSRIQPSVVAVMVDDSISMRVRDGVAPEGVEPPTRLESVVQMLTAEDRALLEKLKQEHEVRLYRFGASAEPLGGPEALSALQPTAARTQVVAAVRNVLEELQGQRVAGVVVLTDGRETPQQARAEAIEAIKDFGVKVFPVMVGSDEPPRNIEIASINMQDSAFKGDVVSVRATVRAGGLPAGQTFEVAVREKQTGRVLSGLDDEPARQAVTAGEGEPIDVELIFKPEEIGTLEVVIAAEELPGELDLEDNQRHAQLEVLDAKVNLLYVDGYPRWDYRFLKTEMMRDKTVEISCLLLSADPTFAQEGDRPIRRFPETITELLEYDVVLFGDVDPRYFSDLQLELIRDFVANRGGGFGMVAGPQWSPQAYQNTPIEALLPVNIQRTQTGIPVGITQGWRPVLTADGRDSSIFRFFADRERNQRYLENEWPVLYWFAQGITTKPGVGEVYAEHPDQIGPDGRKAPLLVVGRFGAGRTLFSAIDDSWRWRYYTGESIFDTYWVQQLRYLARSKKLGQRKVTFASTRTIYELGEQIRVNMRVLDPFLLQQLPDQLSVEVLDETGQVIRQEPIRRQEGQIELFTGSWSADRVGKLRLRLPSVASGIDAMELPVEVSIPRLELVQPQVDRTLLSRLASETMGQAVAAEQAVTALPGLIQSVAQIIPIDSEQPLWDAPLALLLFVLLITVEWVLRKVFGML